MKTMLLPVFLLLFSCCAYSQPAETPAQKVRRLEDMERVAVIKGDTAALFKLWSEQYVVNNSNNMILTAGQIKVFIRKGGMDTTSFKRNIDKLVMTGDIAIVMGTETVSPKNKSDNGGKNQIRRFTDVWLKSDTSWLLSARQATNVR